MAEIVPPPPPPPVQVALPPLSQLILTVPNPPPALAQIALGTPIEGQVIDLLRQGQVRLQTSVGALTVRTGLPLVLNSTLALVVQSAAPQAQLQITSINGQAPHLALRNVAGTATGAGGAAAVAPVSANPPVTLTLGATVTATFLRSIGVPGSQPGTAAATQTGGAGAPQPGAGARAATGTTPAATPSGQPGTAAPAGSGPGTGAPAPGTAPSPLAAGSGQPATTPVHGRSAAAAPLSGGAILPTPPGTQAAVRIVSLQPPGQPIPPTPGTAPGTAIFASGQTVAGTVSGATAPGHAVVHTPLGDVSLATRAPLPVGTSVIFEVVGSPTPLPSQPPAHGAAFMLGEPRHWPQLLEAVQALGEINPQAAQHLVNTLIPRPDAQLAANMLFFLSALRGGDIRSWLGDGIVRDLQRHRPGILARLGESFRQMTRMAEEPIAGDWRAGLIPFHTGAAIEQIRLFLRQQNRNGDEGVQAGTRFVVDVELTRTGRLQLDGLLREGNKHLDLIVRTDAPLAPNMQEDIRGIFNEAGQLTGLKGGVTFQAAPPDFVEVLRETARTDHPGVVV